MTSPLLTNPARQTTFRRRSAAVFAALALTASACGGSDSSSTDGGGGDGGGGATPEDVSGDVDASADDGAPVLGFDASVLPTDPIVAADLEVFDPNAPVTRLPSVDAVVNTCDVLSSADVTTVLTEEADEHSGGRDFNFDNGELLTSQCRFVDQTHVVGVIVGPPDQVSANDPSDILPAAPGDVTATPWADDASITILSEDSFGVDTIFGAHIERDGAGIYIYNSGGTFLDHGDDGGVFARLASIAADNVSTAGPAVAVAADANVETARPCDLFTPAQISAFVDVDFLEIVEVPSTGKTECRFGEFGGNEVRVVIEHVSEFDSSAMTPSATTDGIFTQFESAFFVAGDNVVELRVSVPGAIDGSGFRPSTTAAAAALAENVAARYTG